MKQFRLASFALAAAAILPFLGSCSSDRSPFDVVFNGVEKESAMIKLNLRVAETRAGDLSTDAENAISKVNIYVFNDRNELEQTISPIVISEGQTSVTAEVSIGLKTIYVVTGNAVNNPASGTSHTDFEQTPFDITLALLSSTDNGFVMFGKSAQQMVTLSTSADNIPPSNEFSITLTRLAAKAQVKTLGISGEGFGFTLGNAAFKASQTNDKMVLVNNGSDIVSPYADVNGDGTYDNYSIGTDNAYLPAIVVPKTTEESNASDVPDFTADGCVYMSENIVSVPKSGNTTFLAIRIPMTPDKYYSFSTTDVAPQAVDETPTAGTFYTVGIVDREYGISDYAVDGATHHVMAFKDQADAQRYVSKLNTGQVSPITVSQTESQLRAPSTRDGESETGKFEVFTYTDGYAYYRVNIAHEETSGSINKVVRNKFYKVAIKSVQNLGFSSEALLRPTKADADLDAHGSCWISASFVVAPWDEVSQEVDLR